MIFINSFGLVFYSALIIGIVLGIIMGYGIGQKLQFDYDAKQIKQVSESGKYFKTDYGYYKIFNMTNEYNNMTRINIGFI